jgi:HEAT repeat protein
MKLMLLMIFAVDPAGRMLDPKLTLAQRNDACYDLRGDRSPEAIRALSNALASEPVRACAAERLREAGATSELIGALTDPLPEVRAAAARELGVAAAPEALVPLAAAARDRNALVSSNAAFALTQYPGLSALPQLLDLANDASMAGVTALTRAAELRAPEALAIARRLSMASDPAFRMYAINVIRDLGDTGDLPQLREIATANERFSPDSRGFGLLPAIDLSRAAKNAIAKIEEREH